MKKVLFAFAFLLGLSGTVCAQPPQYDFFAGVTPSGDTLWFLYVEGSTDAYVAQVALTSEYSYYYTSSEGATRNVIIPSTIYEFNVVGIMRTAFKYCSGITSITIPNSVTWIGDSAFANCTGLTSVTIGSGISSIDGAAFRNCNNLTDIHSLNPVAPQLGNYTYNGQTYGAFDGVPSTIPAKIPCGSSGSYYGRWIYFSNFVEDAAFTFNAESADNNMGTVQILTMPTCAAPNAVLYASANSGYHFDHWSTGSTSNPYTLTVTSDTVITAYFVSDNGTEGIGDVEGSAIHIYAEGGDIIVNGIGEEKVLVFDMVVRPVGTQSLPTGVYMVKVGNLPAKRVAVIR